MHIAHVALGGCLTAPPIRFGITGDTGGHIAYLLGAALAQSRRPGVDRVDLVTRAFDDPRLGPAHGTPVEPLDDVVQIRRIAGGGTAYLEKEALEAALPELTESYLDLLGSGPRPDVIHAHFADAAQLALAARERYGIPVVYTPHSLALGKRDCGLDSPGLSRRIARERRAIAEADAIVVSSRDEAERQLDDYGVEAAGRTHRISPGVYVADGGTGVDEASELLAPFLRRPERPLILAIARPVAKKNLAGLLEAYAKTPGLRDAANLAIVAGLRDGPDDGVPEQRTVIAELIAGVDRHDLYGHVALPKRHGPRHIRQLYRLAATTGGVFDNPALHEPFGLTLLEAAEHGLPVVATACGGPTDIVRDLGHGLLVEPDDHAALGAAIERIVTDADTRAGYVAALDGGLGDYDWTTYAGHALDLYDTLAAPDHTRARTRHPRARRLIVSDIDGTLSGSLAGSRRLAEVLRSSRLPFAVSTGRSLPEARRVLARWRLPHPSAFVTAVGTEIHLPDARGRARLDEGYAAQIERLWDREAVREALVGGGASFQRDVEQRRWKLGLLGTPEEARRVRALLAHRGLRATVTHSHGRLIDVTPPGIDKASAMAWLAERWGLSLDECIACGDSGNDAAMLRVAGTAVVVANALPELDGLAGRNVLRTRAPHAGGVAEALERLGLAQAQPTATAIAA